MFDSALLFVGFGKPIGITFPRFVDFRQVKVKFPSQRANNLAKLVRRLILQVAFPEEIAALITLNCDYKSISEVNFLSRIFCVKKERLIELKAIYDGKGEVKDGKNN